MRRTPWSARRSVLAFAVVLFGGLCAPVAAQSVLPDEIVLWTSQVGASDVYGDWRRVKDSSAAGGFALENPDRDRTRIVPALASPTNYFEIAFAARAGTAYHLWIRMKAWNDSASNDSVHVQFSDSVNLSGSPIMRIGTTGSAETLLQNGPTGASPHGWGWTDNGWGSLGSPVYFAADGTHVIRVQQREEGVTIDQIVLSARTYASAPPGSRSSDATILQAAGGGPTAPASGTIVVRPATAAAGRIYGNWNVIADATAAGGQAVRNPNAGATKIAPALANPASYFEATFTATAGRRYHVWFRMRADGNAASNDSVHVQFSGSTTSSGSPTARIGTTNSFEMLLQAGSGAPLPSGWGWTDNGWDALGSHVYFATSGIQTIRVQEREDGPTIDQIVISPDTYLTRPPGWQRDDQTIVPAGEAPPPGNAPPTVSLTAPATGSTFTAPATITLSATASDPENGLSRVDFYNGATLLNSDTTAPYTYTWSGVAAGGYQLKAVAIDAGGGSGTSTIASVTVAATTTNRPPTVSLTAPANGAIYTAPATITLSATASDPENRLARVEFFVGEARFRTITMAPFVATWSGVGAGTYQVRAIAFDAQGASTTSPIATITVSTTTTTKRVAFLASAEHATLVTSYLLEVFPPTANPATATALASSNLGKPTPSSTNEIIVDRTTFLNSLAPGNYLITVAAVGTGGKSRSAAISFTR